VSKKAWIIFIVVIFGLLAALVIWSRGNSTTINTSNIDTNTIQTASKQNGNIADHVFGKADSKVVLVEYGDFQCPGCGSAEPGVEKIINEYKDYSAFVFRNFPLTSAHQNALAAASAVEAAGLQNKYWEMHNLIYTKQTDWENLSTDVRTTTFTSYATQLGLDTTKFKNDMSSSAVSQKISFDQALGYKVSVNSTPTFRLNGVVLSSTILQDVQTGTGDQLRDALDAQLKQAGVTPPTRA
jgi:protein-disulfide isomerase